MEFGYITSLVIIILSIILYKRIKRIHHPTIKFENGKWHLITWGNTQKWSPSSLIAPKSKEEIIEFIKSRKDQNIKEIRAIGGLHSWSSCAVTTGACLDTRNLTKVINIDKQNMRITAEAGITLENLFAVMKKNQMAIGSMVNVQAVTLGGVISNGAHGTNIRYGTMSSFVYAIELIDATGKLHNLTRDSKDPKVAEYFDAALVSFGSLGIFYSITLQCEEEYNMIHIRSRAVLSEYQGDGKFVKLCHQHDSIYFHVNLQTDELYVKINNKVPASTTNHIVKDTHYSWLDIQLQDILLFMMYQFKFTVKFFQKVVFPAAFKKALCVRWDNYEVLRHTNPFINIEYTIPESKIEEAIDTISRVFKEAREKNLYNRNLFWVIRPVGSDDRGFLSITRNDEKQPYYCIDIPYQNSVNQVEKAVYIEIEQKLIALGGRCNFARLFWDQSSTILKNYWDKDAARWKKVKLELDPEHVFTNDLVRKVFFEGK